jgi:capsular polysaccharide transport system permease protein
MNIRFAPANVARDTAGGTLPECRRRRSWPRLPRSFIACVGLPTLAAALYFGAIATDRFVAEARFAVRGNEPIAADVLGAITGLPGQGSSAADSFIVQDYVLSREALESLARHLDFRAMFGRPDVDWWSRLHPAAPIEDVVDYWQDRVSVTFEPTSGINTLRVEAFSAPDAKALAEALLSEGEALVNRLSDRARRDALTFAEGEVRRAEARLADVRQAVTEFRNTRQLLDPARAAEGKLGLVSELEAELARAQTERTTLRGFMSPGAAPIVSVENRIDALKDQLAAEQRRLAGRQPQGSELMSALVADYQKLLAEQEFAERMYTSTLTGLEAARAEALRQHRYLVTFVAPRLPEDSTRPRRLLAVATVFVGALVCWGLGALTVAAVKDHSGWV